MAGFGYFNKLGELRPNQLVTTFGPGSILDAVKDSVTVLDLNYWKEKGKKIIDGRMGSYLGVNYFFMPRTSFADDVPVISFPYMHVCSGVNCGRLFDIRVNFDPEKYLRYGATCPECHRSAFPARFITICKKGHMDDFPWSWWVHKGNTACKGKLYLYTKGTTSTLADIHVKCSLCGEDRSMSGATQTENFDGLKCTGRHPFRPGHRIESCNEKIIPSQRGASNVYFPVTRSAISIPPWTNPLEKLIDDHYSRIMDYREDLGDDGVDLVYRKYFAAFSREDFDKALAKREQKISEYKEIKQMEYDAITHHTDPLYSSNKIHFKAEEDPVPSTINQYLDRIIRATRLREVRVLLGFTRVDAPDPDAEDQPTMTGYSLSTYFDEMVDCIVRKSQSGVFVKFFVNNIDKQKNIDKLYTHRSRFLKIYNYPENEENKSSALHAKVISVDKCKTLITSANLSYNGQEGNIEVGTFIESARIAKQLEETLTRLIFSGVFTELKGD